VYGELHTSHAVDPAKVSAVVKNPFVTLGGAPQLMYSKIKSK